MKSFFIWAVTMALSFAFAESHDVTFKDHGRPVKTLTIEELKQLSPVQTIKAMDPNAGRENEFFAIPFQPLLDKVYGDNWKRSEELLFTCADGYQPSLPRERFEEYESYLAFDIKGIKKFAIRNVTEGNKLISLSPYYLIWNNRSLPALQMGDGGFWPYQLVGVDLIQFVDRFPKLAPPENSSKKIQSGFLHFRKNCLQCHALNGEGGHIGPELNYPVNVTEFYDLKFLKRWIMDPPSIRWKTAMPPFHSATEKDQKRIEQIVDEIIAYLQSMKKKKIRPEGS